MVIYGPTAIGKSDVAIETALKFNAVIVNADSMQLYRYLNIGTAKPTPEQQHTVQHYMLDIIDPDEEFNAGQYTATASHIIDNLDTDRNVIVTGGTFLYIRALLSGLIQTPSKDPEIRQELHSELKNNGLTYLYRRLQDIDPARAQEIHENDHVRIIRALEVFYSTGRKLSSLKEEHAFRELKYNACKVAVYNDRDSIKNNIDTRVENMFKRGLVHEVETLRSMGYSPELKSMQSIGYKQVNMYLDDKILLEESKYLIKRDTKRYAKRQMTWLRKENGLNWYESSNAGKRITGLAKRFFEH